MHAKNQSLKKEAAKRQAATPAHTAREVFSYSPPPRRFARSLCSIIISTIATSVFFPLRLSAFSYCCSSFYSCFVCTLQKYSDNCCSCFGANHPSGFEGDTSFTHCLSSFCLIWYVSPLLLSLSSAPPSRYRHPRPLFPALIAAMGLPAVAARLCGGTLPGDLRLRAALIAQAAHRSGPDDSDCRRDVPAGRLSGRERAGWVADIAVVRCADAALLRLIAFFLFSFFFPWLPSCRSSSNSRYSQALRQFFHVTPPHRRHLISTFRQEPHRHHLSPATPSQGCAGPPWCAVFCPFRCVRFAIAFRPGLCGLMDLR